MPLFNIIFTRKAIESGAVNECAVPLSASISAAQYIQLFSPDFNEKGDFSRMTSRRFTTVARNTLQYKDLLTDR